MILDLTKNFVPESYSDSRDYRVFLRLASILLSVLRDNISGTPLTYSAEDCPREMLSLLADMVGYKYVDSRDVESNRMIIKYFPHLIRYRGSRVGVKIAAALSINSMDEAPQNSLDSIIVEYDYENAIIKIYFPETDILSRDLIEAVRPAGSRVKTVPSSISKSTDEIDVRVDVVKEVKSWDDSRTGVEKSKVGFGDTGSENFSKGGESD